MEPERVKRHERAERFDDFWSLYQLVCRTQRVGREKLRGEPKVAWAALWWDLDFRLGNQGDVTAAQVAAAIGAADAASGRRAIRSLIAVGLVVLDKHDSLTGRYTIWMPDPRDVLRRQASNGQGELFGDLDSDQGSTEPESARVAGRVGTGADAPAGDNRPSVPIPASAGPVPCGRAASAEAPRHPPDGSAADVQAHPPADAPPQLSNLEGRFIYQLQLSAKDPTSAQSVKVPSDGRGGSAGASAEANPFLAAAQALLGGPDPLEAKVIWLRGKIPGLWLEIAEWVIEEVAGRHESPGGERSRFTHDELAKITARTRGLAERKELRRPPAVYFAVACEQRFRQLGLRWPKFQPGKPR